MAEYIIASSHDWHLGEENRRYYVDRDFLEISSPEQFDKLDLLSLSPRFIFFVHWNWIVPKEIFEKYECILFHIAPLPYGRGGSPVQNLIIRNVKEAPVNALKMTDVLDGGPIYAAEEISLEGNITDIFLRAGNAVRRLIDHIITVKPTPIPQKGTVKVFNRLTEADNELKDNDSLEGIYDKIRMVDGYSYPRAYLRLGNLKITFTSANKKGNLIKAQALFEDKSPGES